MSKQLPTYTKGEEIFNAVTHIVGGGFGIIVLVLSVLFASRNDLGGIAILGVVLYGISMICLYTMSAIYHFLRVNKAKRLFRIFDHCTIYLLIAGTYTPICLISLKGESVGMILLISVWVCAIAGIIMNAINMHSKIVKVVSMILYVIMGWCAIFAFPNLIEILSFEAVLWILIGGIFYTFGLIFYSLGRKKKYMHSIWHLFCLLGSITQFVGVLFYIIL